MHLCTYMQLSKGLLPEDLLVQKYILKLDELFSRNMINIFGKKYHKVFIVVIHFLYRENQ